MKAAASKVLGIGKARAAGHAVDASYTLIQDIWGRGCLSPLDVQFGAQAVMRLVPTKGFGFAGLHLGQRLLKYADDMKVRVDAAERDETLTRLYAKKKSSVRNVACDFGASTFKANGYEAFIVTQASVLGVSLETLYGPCAASLKSRGRLFCADLMERESGISARMRPRGVCAPEGWRFRTTEAHVEALQDAGLQVENKIDMGVELLASIRSGFQQSLSVLSQLRACDREQKAKSIPLYLEQIETWGTIYALVESGKLQASAILAVKQR